jgi:hypothetical protein
VLDAKRKAEIKFETELKIAQVRTIDRMESVRAIKVVESEAKGNRSNSKKKSKKDDGTDGKESEVKPIYVQSNKITSYPTFVASAERLSQIQERVQK